MNKSSDPFRIWTAGLSALAVMVFIFLIALLLHGGRLSWPLGADILQSLIPLAGGATLFLALPTLPGPWAAEGESGEKWLMRGLIFAAVVTVAGYLRLYQLTALDTPRTIILAADLITLGSFAYWIRQTYRGRIDRDKLNMVIFGAILAVATGTYATWLHVSAGAGITIWLKWQLTVVLLYSFFLSRDASGK